MTRHKWMSADQEDWLKSRLADFSNAQVNKTTSKEFFPTIFKDWRNTWPTPTPTPEEVAKAGNAEKATQKKRAEEDAHIRAWFHNHTRGATSGNGVRGLLKMKGKQKSLQEWQVYHVMTYKSQWKAVVDKEWENFKSTWKTKHPGKEPTETHFTFMASFMRQKYQEETEEVRSNVRKRQEELKVALEAEGEDKNRAYQSAINRLPRTLAVWGESVAKQTGWNISFLVGRPAPNENGKIMSYIFHCGKSPEGQDFEGFLGEEGYDEHIITPFDDFLHELFPPEVCSSRSLGSKANTPEAEEKDEDEIIKPADGDGMSAKRTTKCTESGMSEYELTQEANIARNKELLRELGLEFGLGSETEQETMKKGKKARKEKQVGEDAMALVRTTEPSTSTFTPMTATNAEKMATDGPIGNPVVKDVVSVTALSTEETDVSLTSSSLTTSVIPQSQTFLSPESNVSVNDKPAAQESPEGPELTTSPARAVSVPAPSPDTSLQQPLPVNSFLKSSTAITPLPSTLTTNGSGPMDIDPRGSATQPTSNQDPMQVDNEKGEETHGSSSADVALVAAPAWLTTLNMDTYLLECSDEKAWQALVQSFYRFEEVNTTSGKLPTTSCPDEVAAWIKSKKKTLPPDVDADGFGSAFMAWWIALQPEWRIADDGSFKYDTPVDEDWRVLHKGGKAGLYTVVVALSWWLRVLTPDIPSFRVWTAVRDIRWVIDQISTKLCSPATKKRPLEDIGQAGKAKRGRNA